jgi:hypothetical protein
MNHLLRSHRLVEVIEILDRLVTQTAVMMEVMTTTMTSSLEAMRRKRRKRRRRMRRRRMVDGIVSTLRT